MLSRAFSAWTVSSVSSALLSAAETEMSSTPNAEEHFSQRTSWCWENRSSNVGQPGRYGRAFCEESDEGCLAGGLRVVCRKWCIYTSYMEHGDIEFTCEKGKDTRRRTEKGKQRWFFSPEHDRGNWADRPRHGDEQGGDGMTGFGGSQRQRRWRGWIHTEG